MKTSSFGALLVFFACTVVTAQEIPQPFQAGTVYVITTTDGGEFVGTVESADAREIVIATTELGDVAIPKHTIRSTRTIDPGYVGIGLGVMADEVFSTRYLFTTNGFPLEAGNHYFNLSPIGPDIQFAVAENFGVGLLSSWAGFPLIVSLKYTLPFSGFIHAGLGALVGSGTYFDPDFGGALPYGSVTMGNRRYNLTVSGGYGYLFNGNLGNLSSEDIGTGGYTLLSVSGMGKLTRNLTLVFDTVIVPEKRAAIMAIPLVRWQNKADRAWQIGFAGTLLDGEYSPPIPIIQWYRKLD